MKLDIIDDDYKECDKTINDNMFKYLRKLKHLNCSRMYNITGYGDIPPTLISLVIGCEMGFNINAFKAGKYINLKYSTTCHYYNVTQKRNILSSQSNIPTYNRDN